MNTLLFMLISAVTSPTSGITPAERLSVAELVEVTGGMGTINCKRCTCDLGAGICDCEDCTIQP